MSPRLLFTWMIRESRGARGRLAFFTACLAIGVAAVVGVASLVAAIRDGIGSQSKRLLAADLVVDARRPLPEELDSFFPPEAGVVRADVREMATLVAAGDGGEGRSRLAELKVVDGPYPLYGEVALDPPGTLEATLDAHRVAVGPDLLDALDLAVGDRLLVGGAEFEIAAVVREEPDRLDFSLLLGPRVFVSRTGLDRTALLGFGNRVRYRALFKLPRGTTRAETAATIARMKAELPGADFLGFETPEEAQPAVRRALERVESFLGLVALLSLVLGGIGVAQIVGSWLASRTESIAVLRSIGFRPRDILVLFLGHVAGLSLVGSLIGGAIGLGIPLLITRLAPDLFPTELLVLWQPAALVRGVGLGMTVALLFSIPALTAVWRVSPARVLRAEADPLPPPRLVRLTSFALLGLGVLGAAWLQSGSLPRGAIFTGGLLAVGLTLALAARLLMLGARRLPRERLDPYLRHGIAALARPAAGTTGAIVALGLGFLVVLTMSIVESRLAARLRGALPDDAPSVFMMDIQPDQWDGVRGLLVGEDGRGVRAVPVIMARLAAVDGRTVEELIRDASDEGRARWVLTREQRLTWMAELSSDNRIVAGELWSDPDRGEVSLERGFARDLGAGVGSVVRFDVQGIPIELAVTSLRDVEWESFNINFFVVAEPGTLDDAPGFRLAVARLEPDAESRVQNRLAREFPNVTMLRIRPILEKVLALLLRLALGVRILGSFTIAAGLAILAGAIASTAVRRGREIALLKTLGVTRRGAVALLATEYGLVGLVTGGLGAAGAFVLSWAFLEHVLEIPAELPWIALPFATLGGASLTALCGLAATTRALRVKPMEVLRT